jgi:phage tail-like protein
VSRALVEGLATPVPLGSLLPDVYQRHDENILTFAAALDEVIAPVWLALDCFDGYVDPMLAPTDFLTMLSQWVAFPLDGNWSEDQARRLVATAVELYRWRGTKRGLVELVKAYATVEPEVIDSGGATWSAEPGSSPPGSPEPAVRIVVALPRRVSIDLERMTRLIAANVPAHVSVTVEVQRGGKTTQMLDAATLRSHIEALPSAGVAGGSAELSPYGATPAAPAYADVVEPSGAEPRLAAAGEPVTRPADQLDPEEGGGS